jgi:hypothetical protein
LATTDDARVHCAVLKIRAVPAHHQPPGFGRPTLLRMTHQAAVPSGPNSVLGLCDPQDQASRAAVSCDTAAVLTCPG